MHRLLCFTHPFKESDWNWFHCWHVSCMPRLDWMWDLPNNLDFYWVSVVSNTHILKPSLLNFSYHDICCIGRKTACSANLLFKPPWLLFWVLGPFEAHMLIVKFFRLAWNSSFFPFYRPLQIFSHCLVARAKTPGRQQPWVKLGLNCSLFPRGDLHQQSQILQKVLLIGGPVEKALMKEFTSCRCMKAL